VKKLPLSSLPRTDSRFRWRTWCACGPSGVCGSLLREHQRPLSFLTWPKAAAGDEATERRLGRAYPRVMAVTPSSAGTSVGSVAEHDLLHLDTSKVAVTSQTS